MLRTKAVQSKHRRASKRKPRKRKIETERASRDKTSSKRALPVPLYQQETPTRVVSSF